MSILSKNTQIENEEETFDISEVKERFSDGDEIEVVYESYRSGEVKSSVGTVNEAKHTSEDEVHIYSEKHESTYNRMGKIVITKNADLKNTSSHTPYFGDIKAIRPVGGGFEGFF